MFIKSLTPKLHDTKYQNVAGKLQILICSCGQRTSLL